MASPEFERRMAQLRDAFLAGLADSLATLHAALAAGDRSEARMVAHGLAGRAGTFGFAAISEAAVQVEVLLDAGEAPPDALAAALEALDAAGGAALAQPQ